ncbi:hypothetical protein VM1G_02913 [Cytospora mali]|uniref:Uncharacterized protein n=1 Tax=Cytospora mali TaxID=578113 RepID=A0A194VTK5_CYTMA|nr:hypothetical protein VM1G_02913 [Valsa mali]
MFDEVAMKPYERFYELERVRRDIGPSAEERREELCPTVKHDTDHGDPASHHSMPRATVYTLVKFIADVDLDYELQSHEAAFFLFMVDDAHKPAGDRFGRYPYRNAIEGRMSTQEELEWMEKTDYFAAASPDVARRMKEDIEAGRRTPLEDAENPSLDHASRIPADDLLSDARLEIAVRLEHGRSSSGSLGPCNSWEYQFET